MLQAEKLAEILHALNTGGSTQQFEKLIEENPLIMIFFYLEKKDITEADKYYKQLGKDITPKELFEELVFAIYDYFKYDYTKLIQLFTQYSDKLYSSEDTDEISNYLLKYLCKYYTNYLLETGDAKEAYSLLKTSIKSRCASNQSSICVELYLNLAHSQIVLGYHSEGKKSLDTAKTKALKIPNPKLMSEFYYYSGIYYMDRIKLDKALNCFTQALEFNKDDTYSLIFQLETFRGIIFILQQLKRYDEAEKYANLGLADCKKQEDVKWKVKFLIDLANLYFLQEKYQSILDLLDVENYTHGEIPFKLESGKINFILGQTYHRLGDMAKSDQHFSNSMMDLETSNYVTRTINYYLILSKIYEDRGLINQAIEILLKAEKKSNEINNDYFLATTYFNLGRLYILEGDLLLAKELLNANIHFFTKINPGFFLPSVYYQLSEISRLTGNLNEAETFNLKAAEIIDSLNDDSEKARNYYQLGLIKKDKGLTIESESYFIKSKELYQKIKDFKKLPSVYFELGLLKISQGSFDEIEQYLEDLKTITKRYPTHENTVIPLLLKSIYQSSQKRAKDKFLAQGRLETIIEMDSVPFNYKIIAMLQMAQLLLYEFQLEKEDDLLKRVRSILDELEALGNQNKSYILVIESSLLRSNIAKHQDEYNEANEFLQKARFLCEEKNLQFLLDKISHEETELSLEISRIESALSKAGDLTGPAKSKFYENYIKSMMDMVHRFEQLEDEALEEES